MKRPLPSLGLYFIFPKSFLINNFSKLRLRVCSFEQLFVYHVSVLFFSPCPELWHLCNKHTNKVAFCIFLLSDLVSLIFGKKKLNGWLMCLVVIEMLFSSAGDFNARTAVKKQNNSWHRQKREVSLQISRPCSLSMSASYVLMNFIVNDFTCFVF